MPVLNAHGQLRATQADLIPIRKAAKLCALCGGPFTASNPPVVDHCHSFGHIRGVLHRGCNSMLGVIENNRARYFLSDPNKLKAFLSKVVDYSYASYSTNMLYPTHRTPAEKLATRNKKARAAYAAKKGSKT